MALGVASFVVVLVVSRALLLDSNGIRNIIISNILTVMIDTISSINDEQ